MTTLFLEPLDVLFLRGNKLFGDPGSFGESLVPPWPSVAAGALRSRMLADAGIDIAAFASGKARHEDLGTPSEPGPFTLTAFHLARQRGDGTVEVLMQPPADLVISEDDARHVTVRTLTPTPLPGREGLQCSAPLPRVPVLAESQRSKPASGYWLTETGWRKYLTGQTPDTADLIKTNELWGLDFRVGIGLDPGKRSAAEGKLFSVQAVAMRPDVGFLAAVCGAKPPQEGVVRFGGDGRAAAIHAVDYTPPEPDYETIVQSRRCRLVLTTPGIFSTPLPGGAGPGVRAGWLPTGAQPNVRRKDGAIRFELYDVKGWIVCAAVPRFEVVSGWDLAEWQPKPAQRMVPTGAVYWFDQLEATAEQLRELAAQGLWTDPPADAGRRAEGFNRFAWALWP